MGRQKTVFIFLLGVLLLAIFYAYFQFPRQSRMKVPPIPAERKQQRQLIRGKAGPGEENRLRVRFDWLRNEKPFSGAKQDLFGPLYAPQNEPSSLPIKTNMAATPAKAIGKAVVATPPLKFLGYLASGETRTFFFSQGEDLYVVKRGQLFGKRKEYRISQVTSKDIGVRKRGEADALRLSLTEKAPLSGLSQPGHQKGEKSSFLNKKSSLPRISNGSNAPDIENDGLLEPNKDVEQKPSFKGLIIP